MNKVPEDFLAIAKIARPHSLRGELKVEILTDFPEDIVPGRKVFILYDDNRTAHEIESVRVIKGGLLLKLIGIDDRDRAEDLRGAVIEINAVDAHPLQADEYWHHDIIGCQVLTEADVLLGQVSDILETGGNDVYVVKDKGGQEHLIPVIKDVVIKIDIEDKKITIRPIPGLLEE